jgi:hypothetical protein
MERFMVAVLRILITTSLVGGVLLAGYWTYTFQDQQRVMEELRALNEEMQQRLEERQAMIERLSRSHRLGHVRVLDQTVDDAGEVLDTTVELVELNDRGGELGRQQFTVPGDVVFVDAWTAKFEARDVADGHPLRGKTLVLLRRIYSDKLPAIDGFAIDTPGSIPAGYAVGEVGQFEQQVWSHFWDIAGDAATAAKFGVRVAQGEAVYKPVHKGQVFELHVDAVGGISLSPLAEESAQVTDATAHDA